MAPGVNVPLHVLHYHTLQVKRIYESKISPPPSFGSCLGESKSNRFVESTLRSYLEHERTKN